MSATKFRKKPVVIEALQVPLPDDMEAWGKLLGWFFANDFNGFHVTELKGLDIETLEGIMHANVDDFIIRGVEGEFYPCASRIFAITYEEVLP